MGTERSCSRQYLEPKGTDRQTKVDSDRAGDKDLIEEGIQRQDTARHYRRMPQVERQAEEGGIAAPPACTDSNIPSEHPASLDHLMPSA